MSDPALLLALFRARRRTCAASVSGRGVCSQKALLCLILGALLLWLGFRSWLSFIQTAGKERCLDVPSHWTLADNENDTWAAPGTGMNAPVFVLVWSTNSSFFKLRSKRCIESIFFHHPSAIVRVYSNELPLYFLREFTLAGFAVSVQRYELTELLRGTPAVTWLSRKAEWQRGPYFYSHLSDIMRVALLFKHGGVYLDFDMILTRPLKLLRGREASRDHVSSLNASLRGLHNALGIESFYNGDPRRPILNGAFMYFQRGSRFLWNCMQEYTDTYRPDLWGWNGPELLTRVHARCASVESGLVQLEPPATFYPIHWEQAATFAGSTQARRQDRMLAKIRRFSYAVHLWNKKTAPLRLDRQSLFHRLLHTFVVLKPLAQ